MSREGNDFSTSEPKGIYIPIITKFEELSEAFYETAKAEVNAGKEVDDAKRAMDVLGLKIEMAVIQSAGSEKAVGSSEAARQRAYNLARSESPAYNQARDFYLNTKLDYRYHKHMLRLLDMRGQFIIASMG